MNTIAITIGRNIGNTPMDEKSWDDFRLRVFLLVDGHPNISIVGQYDGEGVWEDQEEASCAIVALIAGPDQEDTTHNLRNALRIIGRSYGQEAIGFIAAPSSTSLIECTNS